MFAGIAPWNFPAMIPMGWMAPTLHRHRQHDRPEGGQFRAADLHAHLRPVARGGATTGRHKPDYLSRREAEILLRHADVKGISFVGSTSVGKHIYATAAANGKRVQALTEAKNHALVLKDAALERSARGIINSACGCAGERCMALPVVVAEEAIADDLVATLKRLMQDLKIGPAYDQTASSARWSMPGTASRDQVDREGRGGRRGASPRRPGP